MKELEMLGCKVTDKVTGFKGVASSISYDMVGCIQAFIAPPAAKDSTIPEGRWFDCVRLDVGARVLPEIFSASGRPPREKGATEKSAPRGA